jgi:hypothetical protein
MERVYFKKLRWAIYSFKVHLAKRRVEKKINKKLVNKEDSTMSVNIIPNPKKDFMHFRIYDNYKAFGLSKGFMESEDDFIRFHGRIDPTNFQANYEAPTVQYLLPVLLTRFMETSG